MLFFSSVAYLDTQQHQLCHFSNSSRVTFTSVSDCQCYIFSSVAYLNRQQLQLCHFSNTCCVTFTSVKDYQGYFSPVSGFWKDSNTSCVTFTSVKDDQGYFSPVSGIWKDSNTSCVTFTSVKDDQGYFSPVSGKTATPAVSLHNTSCVTFTSVKDYQGYFFQRQVSGLSPKTCHFLSCVELLRLSLQYLGSQLKQVCPGTVVWNYWCYARA